MLPNKRVTPSTKPKLAILEPTTLLNAKSDELFKAAFILTISSGAEVAKETTVIPIITLGIFNFKEIETADFNNQLPPKINKPKPIKISKKFIKNICFKDTTKHSFF